VTPDDVGVIGPQRIRTRLNGETVQSATLGEMIFSIPVLINYVSSFTPLRPGDVICTGTPGGVGAKREPPLFMKPGDRVEVEIDGVGLLASSIVSED
jgi:2-keto-4-pentenoate hydratase/2-oxohepta-3-ene-1,7-dioic acid hydratase in catechol pathway